MSRKLYEEAIENSLVRTMIIIDSTYFELMLSKLLCAQLNIDIETSSSFNKSGALSFDNKVKLLLDMKSISKDERSKLDLFMQIRNKFAHVLQINSFQDCFDAFQRDEGNNGRENKLKKLFNNYQSSGNRETDLRGCYDLLYADINSCIERILSFYIKGKIDDGSLAVNAHLGEKYLKIVTTDALFGILQERESKAVLKRYSEVQLKDIAFTIRMALMEYGEISEALKGLNHSVDEIIRHFPSSKDEK